MGVVAKLRRDEQRTELELISPKTAETYLESNTQNRSLSTTTVQALADEMTGGRWRLHHQGIAFDTNGILRDGQHRLKAVCLSGKTVPMMVTRGIDQSVFDTIDAHRPRKVGDQLILTHNLPQGRRIAATSMVINTVEQDAGFGRRLAIGLTLEIYTRHKEGVDFALSAIQSGPFSKAPLIGPVALAYKTNPDKAALFAKQMRDGEKLTKRDPAYALRTLVINSTGMSSGLDRRTFAVATLRCLHAHFEGEQLGTLRQNVLVDSETYAKARRYFLKAHQLK